MTCLHCSNLSSIVFTGGTTKVLRALELFPLSVDVCDAGCCAIRNLVADQSYKAVFVAKVCVCVTLASLLHARLCGACLCECVTPH